MTTYHETVRLNPWIKKELTVLPNGRQWWGPHPKQQRFLLHTHVKEVFYGGSGGGGKSQSLWYAALQYVDVPGYSALILRRTYADLAKSGALMDRSKAYLAGTGAVWNERDKRWTFPNGARIEFGYLDTEADKYRYASAEYQYIAFDELTHFTESQYSFLFTRLRRLSGSAVPLRMRSASNPGGVGHYWVKQRFVNPRTRAAHRLFIPATLDDNPSLDRAEYVDSLSNTDDITRRQILAGDWDAYEGGRFHAEWFREFCVDKAHDNGFRYYVQIATRPGGDPVFETDGMPVEFCYNVVAVDPAARDDDKNDYTAIVTAAVTKHKDILILDVIREKLPIERIVPKIAEVCRGFSPLYVGMEDAAFQLALIREAQKHEDIPAVRRLSPMGKGKLERATPAIIRSQEGQIYLPEKGKFPWMDEFLGELVQFTGDPDQDSHDDQVDALAYLVLSLERQGLLAPTVVEEQEQAPDDDWLDRTESLGGWQR